MTCLDVVPRVHLFAVTPDLESVLVFDRPVGWRVPAVDIDGHPGLADRLCDELAQLATNADLVHWAPLGPEPGREVADAYCAAVIRGAPKSEQTGAVFRHVRVAVARLPPNEARPLETALRRLGTPIEAFDSHAGVTELLTWARQTASAFHEKSDLIRRYRCARHEHVVGLSGANGEGATIVKAGAERVADEAVLAQLLWALCPQRFPRTIAMDLTHHRWLYEALPGTQLSSVRLTPSVIEDTARTLAAIQKQTQASPAIRAHLTARDVNAAQIYSRTAIIVEDALGQHSLPDERGSLLDAWRAMKGAIKHACEEADTLDLPRTLVLSDFWTDNILITPRGIGVIDVGNSYWSFPYLSLWRLTRDVERRVDTSLDARSLLERTFVDEWSDVVDSNCMRRGLSYLPVVGQLFGMVMASCDLDRYERALGEALPVGYRAGRLGPRIRELLITVGMRSVFSATAP